jgi:hypothetical protein
VHDPELVRQCRVMITDQFKLKITEGPFVSFKAATRRRAGKHRVRVKAMLTGPAAATLGIDFSHAKKAMKTSAPTSFRFDITLMPDGSLGQLVYVPSNRRKKMVVSAQSCGGKLWYSIDGNAKYRMVGIRFRWECQTCGATGSSATPSSELHLTTSVAVEQAS